MYHLLFGHQTWDLEGVGQINTPLPPPAYSVFKYPSMDRVNSSSYVFYTVCSLPTNLNYTINICNICNIQGVPRNMTVGE